MIGYLEYEPLWVSSLSLLSTMYNEVSPVPLLVYDFVFPNKKRTTKNDHEDQIMNCLYQQ